MSEKDPCPLTLLVQPFIEIKHQHEISVLEILDKMQVFGGKAGQRHGDVFEYRIDDLLISGIILVLYVSKQTDDQPMSRQHTYIHTVESSC
jgi:hypothetical protein